MNVNDERALARVESHFVLLGHAGAGATGKEYEECQEQDWYHFASRQLSPIPMSAIMGTSNRWTFSISRFTICAISSASRGGASNSNSSCTCSNILGSRFSL